MQANRVKRQIYRATHRGTLESDTLLGGFVVRHAGTLNGGELDALDRILDEADADLLDWILGKRPLPGHLDEAMMRRLIDYKNNL